MPAKIIVTGGNGPDQEFWIEEEVLRIGSDPTCDLRLALSSVAPHAATLEFIDGSYVVYNRSTTPIGLGGQALPPGRSGVWAAAAPLSLEGGVTLYLEIEGNPAPARHAGPAVADDFQGVPDSSAELPAAEEAEPVRSGGGMGGLAQIAIILVCLGAFGALLFTDPNELLAGSSSRPNGPGFGWLIRQLCDPKYSGDRALSAMRSALQSARIAEARGDAARAREIYDEVRNALVARGSIGACPSSGPGIDAPPKPGEETPDIDCLVWAYVKSRR